MRQLAANRAADPVAGAPIRCPETLASPEPARPCFAPLSCALRLNALGATEPREERSEQSAQVRARGGRSAQALSGDALYLLGSTVLNLRFV